MKANEAPTKIYLDEDESWHLTNPNGDSIEYVRKNAFIEKTKNWLYLQLNEINMEGEDMKNFLKDFKNYMKGE